MRNTKVRALVESAIMIAIATVLSMIKIIDLPYGGSVTIASMFPIAIISYRHGIKWGCATGLVYGVLQQLLGLSTLSYFTSWQSIIAIILLDYVVAFAVAGLGGTFRKVTKNQATALALGSLLVCILRYLCHVLSGATVWVGVSIPSKAALAYSFVYNATYMLPETVIMIIVAVYLGAVMNFNAQVPVRIIKNENTTVSSIITALSGLPIAAALIVDVALVFSKLQNAETGEFAIEQIVNVNWMLVAIVSAVATILAIVLLMIGRLKRNVA
ncbi:MAG: energy-coupled thiamine transporter ThiT [Clostridia bacterium]|nr:energy-coupled thiamine transporter ThiT [Clostridia bacterium]